MGNCGLGEGLDPHTNGCIKCSEENQKTCSYDPNLIDIDKHVQARI